MPTSESTDFDCQRSGARLNETIRTNAAAKRSRMVADGYPVSTLLPFELEYTDRVNQAVTPLNRLLQQRSCEQSEA